MKLPTREHFTKAVDHGMRSDELIAPLTPQSKQLARRAVLANDATDKNVKVNDYPH